MGKACVTRDIKLIDIGNSRGIRLPKALLQKYGWKRVPGSGGDGVWRLSARPGREQAVVDGNIPQHGR